MVVVVVESMFAVESRLRSRRNEEETPLPPLVRMEQAKATFVARFCSHFFFPSLPLFTASRCRIISSSK